jgi:hypothetical protein
VRPAGSAVGGGVVETSRDPAGAPMQRRAELCRLEASLAAMRKTIQDLEERRGELLVRSAVLSLLDRVAAEADAHLARFGAAPMLQAAALTEGGGEPGACAELGAPAPTALEERVDFLRPGRSLLGLEG